jgi:2'-phosphotransferase
MKWNKLKSLKVTFPEIQEVVRDNAKQRFSLKALPSTPESSVDPAHYLIRANQGHSIAIESAALLTPITIEAGNVPPTVVHGTYYGNYESIVASGGLKKMGRNHVHFSTGLPEDKEGVISGMRSDAEILIYVDVEKSLRESSGLNWWISENGVVLTEGDGEGVVGTKWWKKVVGRRQEIGTLWEDGKMVAELPVEFQGRKAPSGKSRGLKEGNKGKGSGKGGKGGKGKEASAKVSDTPGEALTEGA